MAQLVWTRQSRQDIESIRAYIAIDAPRRAEDFIRKLTAATKRLRKAAYLGQVVPELGRESVREILFGNYRIIYRVSDQLIEVVSVYHSARLLDDRILDR